MKLLAYWKNHLGYVEGLSTPTFYILHSSLPESFPWEKYIFLLQSLQTVYYMQIRVIRNQSVHDLDNLIYGNNIPKIRMSFQKN